MSRKLVFICHKRPELDARQFAAEWASARHAAIVEQIPGLTKYVHNYVGGSDNPSAPDGIGELWFDTDQALEKGASSPEMAAAVEDAEAFLDMDRTFAVPVSEATIVG
jgi:uncharacterized protein (TIGR02118 family)